ncbi:MAG: radical SAM protein [Candidatus Brocadia sp.]|nr:radical SAM protein [Candidatus Brocadia sp.]
MLLLGKYKVDFIDFIDENFLVDKNRFFKFLGGIEERKFKFSWFVGARANYFNPNYLTNDVIARASALGCVMMGIGAESGSQRVLDFLKKGITVEQIENAARILNKHRIVSEFSFMIGLPYETSDDMLKTISFVKNSER